MEKVKEDHLKEKQKEEDKKHKIFEMMQQNIQNDKDNKAIRQNMEKSTDHLINPIEFQLMDQHEKMRDKVSKEKKLTDDAINRKIFFTAKMTQQREKKEQDKVGAQN